MAKPLKYIKDLEAAGFERVQAKAQVQMVLDAIESDLVTKTDLALQREHIDGRFAEIDSRFARRFTELEKKISEKFTEIDHRFAEIDRKFIELELRLVIKLGLITVSTMTIAVAILSWLIKIQ